MAFARVKASAAQRGYGKDHIAERKRRLPLFTSSDPCGACGRALGEDRRSWHLPHSRCRTYYLPGFWHASCNVREGSQAGRARQTSSQLRW